MIDYRKIAYTSKAWHFQSHLWFICQPRIQFLCWHRACTVLLAAFGTQHPIAAVSCPTPTPHVAPPGLPNRNTWGSSPSCSHQPPNHSLCNQHSLQPWNSQDDLQSPFQKVFPKVELPPLQLCHFKQSCDLHVLKGTAVTAAQEEKHRDESSTFMSISSRKQPHWGKNASVPPSS